ncbi:hypothetical protein IV500_05315 [Paeniglutamicibacter antarcticus]|uniref:Uncharacterized protein n=1 Tax=Arthrobacter terrae TaxID=2935737 RepID=A0A931G728_9MICC|nr:hypothetical protein [Arthrobacter terrae]MBG0738839.1 hypothetical protein [Arthrobacter terrae]
MSAVVRQRKGVPSGGQFATTAHADPSVQLQQFAKMEKVFAHSPGTRVMTGNEFGTISDAGKDRRENITVNLDGGTSLYQKASRVVPWEAYLDTVMPTTEYNPDSSAEDTPQQDADAFFRAALVRMRNARDASIQADSPYFNGIAVGEAEVAAALANADADPATIEQSSATFLGMDGAGLDVTEIKKQTAAPLSMTRARRLAGYFTTRAVELQHELGSKAASDWGRDDWQKHGTKFVFSSAAVRFAGGALRDNNRFYEDRFNSLVMEGETDTDTIVSETFDDAGW